MPLKIAQEIGFGSGRIATYRRSSLSPNRRIPEIPLREETERQELSPNRASRSSKRFVFQTDDHDFNFKVKHAIKVLEEGNKIGNVHFRGPAIAYKEQENSSFKFAQALEEYGKVELMPKLEGNRMFLHLAPLPSKKKK